jgi:hypothetical protein
VRKVSHVKVDSFTFVHRSQPVTSNLWSHGHRHRTLSTVLWYSYGGVAREISKWTRSSNNH